MSSGDYWYKEYYQVEYERDAYKEFLNSLLLVGYLSNTLRSEIADLLKRYEEP